MSFKNRRSLPVALAGLLFLSLTACSSKSKSNAPPGFQPPAFSASRFTAPTNITNPYFPLSPGATHVFLVRDGEDRETIVVEVLSTTRTVQGIACVVVRDRVFSDGLLIEDTHDWYAQDDTGNVWYMGEDVDDYEYDEEGNVIAITHEGAWEAGRDIAGRGTIAQPGYIMPANPQVGMRYYQEYYRGSAEDTGEVVARDVPITLADGSSYTCVKIRDASTLTTGSEFKYFAPGIGKVREEAVDAAQSGELVGRFRPGPTSVPNIAAMQFSNPTEITNPLWPLPLDTTQIMFGNTEDGPETILVERVNATKTVMNIPCVVVRDRVFRDGLLVEDTHDWYAQDDAGNVWYMGEEVDNYHYDENGKLIEITHEGAWEAGLDVAKTGTTALPGYAMTADPQVGDSYHQEYYAGQATDMGAVVAVDVAVKLEDGRTFSGCVQTLDWNPLAPDGIEYKIFAPGLGLVREEVLHDDELLEHIGTFQQGAAQVPDFAKAKFTSPTLIDHPFLPLPGGASWNYEKETEEGLEEIEVSVQAATRTVAKIACIEALYTKTLEGRKVEVARDWYAQDDDGNVWYMGEEVDNYHYDENGKLLEITHEGSWEAGLDVSKVGHTAQPGFVMPAKPAIGQSYYQEYYRTAAEDMGFVVATGLELEVGNHTFENVLQTVDWNPLEPDAVEYKYYAPGIGLVMELHVGDSEEINRLIKSSLLVD